METMDLLEYLTNELGVEGLLNELVRCLSYKELTDALYYIARNNDLEVEPCE